MLCRFSVARTPHDAHASLRTLSRFLSRFLSLVHSRAHDAPGPLRKTSKKKFRGWVTHAHANGKFDISYDDGDSEKGKARVDIELEDDPLRPALALASIAQ